MFLRCLILTTRRRQPPVFLVVWAANGSFGSFNFSYQPSVSLISKVSSFHTFFPRVDACGRCILPVIQWKIKSRILGYQTRTSFVFATDTPFFFGARFVSMMMGGKLKVEICQLVNWSTRSFLGQIV